MRNPVAGVQSLAESAVVIRLAVKTEPSEQWTTARELRRRIKIAFEFTKDFFITLITLKVKYRILIMFPVFNDRKMELHQSSSCKT